MKGISRLMILLLIFSAIPLSAAYIPLPKSLTITFNFTGIFEELYQFGFTTKEPKEMEASLIQSVDDLHLNFRNSESFEYELGEENIYAWWRVAIPSQYTISLYAEDKLISETGNELDWSVSWDNPEGRMTVGGDEGYGFGSGKVIYKSPIKSSSDEFGYKELFFDVDISDDVLPGDYTGRLIMRFSTV